MSSQQQTNPSRSKNETIAVDVRSVTLSGSTALVSIPGADRTIAGSEEDNLHAKMEVIDEGDRIRVEAVIDKPDDETTNE